MVACTERRLEQWETGDTRDMETEMRDLTLEILFATLFGRELVPGEDQERDAADGLNEWFTPSSWILPTGFRHQLAVGSTTQRSGFDRKFGASLRREEGSQSVSPSVVDDGVAGGGQQRPEESSSNMDPSDLLTQLQRIRNSDDGGEQLTTEEIEDQLITMVFAGHETTATALAFTWYVLATHPDIRERFDAELETVLGDHPQPTTISKTSNSRRTSSPRHFGYTHRFTRSRAGRSLTSKSTDSESPRITRFTYP